MVRKSRKKKGVLRRQVGPELDLPVANFVDSREKSSRVRKSDSGNFKVMSETVVESEEVPDDWFDRDEEDVAMETSKLVITISPKHKPELKIFTTKKYTNYPHDFWYLLSRYINP